LTLSPQHKPTTPLRGQQMMPEQYILFSLSAADAHLRSANPTLIA